MKIFLDTADTKLIRDGFNTGLIDGVTTNPTLIMKSGRNPEDVYRELIDMGVPDISMEVVGNRKECIEKVKDLRKNLEVMRRLKFLVHLMDLQFVDS